MKGNGYDSNSLKFIFKEIPDPGSMIFRTFHWNLQIRRGATLIPFYLQLTKKILCLKAP